MMMNLLQALVVMLAALLVSTAVYGLFRLLKHRIGERWSLGLLSLVLFGMSYYLVVTP